MDPGANATATMTDDEVAAFHEAAHAAFAAFGPWTRLAGPVALGDEGCGDVVMATDGEAISRTLASNPAFDRDLPRIDLICCLLAGPIAERMLRERGRTEATEGDLGLMCRNDYEVVAEQIAQIDPPRLGLLSRLERDVRLWLEQPAHWAIVERFAAILLERRRLTADEASAILAEIRAATHGEEAPAEEKAGSSRALLFVIMAMAAGAICYAMA